MKEKKYTALIILNYNNYEDTFHCIESVEKYNTSPIKFIIVDNGSTRKDTVFVINQYLQSRYGENYQCLDEFVDDNTKTHVLKNVTFVVSHSNDGYAQGNNKGLRLAYHDEEIERIMILNNDVLFVEDIIGKLISYQKRLSQCAIISPVLYKRDMNEYDLNCARLNHTNWEVILAFLFSFKNFFGYYKRSEQRRYLLLEGRSKNNHILEVELPSGSCMLFEKSLMDEIKVFDKNTFLYYEENILFKQIARVGKKNYVVTDLKCIHLGASSTSKSSSSFVARKGMDSADYYLHHYCTLTFVQSVVWNIAKFLFKLKLNTIRRK